MSIIARKLQAQMSKEQFPPRVWFTEDLEETFCGFKAPDKYPLQYLSLQEHESLLADKDAEIAKLQEKLRIAEDAFDAILDADSIDTITDDEEREYWLNQVQVNFAIEDAKERIIELSQLRAEAGRGEGR